MPRYMLDTDISSYIMKRSRESVLRKLREVRISDMCISAITKSELLYGVEVSPRRERDRTTLTAYLRYVGVLAYDDAAADHYARIRTDLKVKGMLIGLNDLFIAAHARSLGLTLVTNNTRDYSRVPELALENWAEPDGI